MGPFLLTWIIFLGVVLLAAAIFMLLLFTGIIKPLGYFNLSTSANASASGAAVKRLRIQSTGGSTASRLRARALMGAMGTRAAKTVASDGRAPTAAEQAALGIDDTYRVVTFTGPQDHLNYSDLNEWDFHADLREADEAAAEAEAAEGGHSVVMRPRGANDLVAPIDSLSSTFHSIYFTTAPHMWEDGFNPGPETPLTAADITNFQAVSKAAHTLVGTPGVPVSGSTDDAPYSYNTQQTNDFDMYPVPEETDLSSATLTGTRLHGLMFMAADGVVYTVNMGTDAAPNLQRFRVVLNEHHPTIKLMGAKQIQDDDGVFKYYDQEAKVLVAEPNANILTFWNQNEDERGPPDDASAEEKAQFAAEEAASVENERLLTTMYQAERMGIPIEILNTVDLNALKSSNLTLDIFSVGYVGFRDAKAAGFADLAALAQDKVAMLNRFDLRTLQIAASVSTA